MRSHWRRMLAIAPLLAAALLVSVSGSARAAKVVGVEIYSPTESSPIKWARPGGTVTVTTRVTFVRAADIGGDDNDIVWVTANVDIDGTYLTDRVTVPAGQSSASKSLSVSVQLPDSIAEGCKKVGVSGWTESDKSTQTASELDAVYVDATPPGFTWGRCLRRPRRIPDQPGRGQAPIPRACRAATAGSTTI